MHLKSRFVLLFCTLLVCAVLAQTSFFSRTAEQSLSLLFNLRGPLPTSQSIIIIGIDEESIEKIGPWPFPRQLHAKVLERLIQARVVGFDLLFTAGDSDMTLLKKKGVPAVMAVASDYRGLLLAPDVSKNPWIRLGHVETELGRDGIVRQVEPVKNKFSSLAFVMAGMKPEDVMAPHKRRLINFYGPEFTFLYLSFYDVLHGDFPLDFFADRYVFVGSRALALGDAHNIPFSRHYPVPGVEIQATILNNLLDSSFLKSSNTYTWLGGGILLLVLAFIWPRKSELKNFLLNLGCIGGVGILSLSLFHKDIFFDPVVPVFILVFGYILHLGMLWMTITRRVFHEVQGLNIQLEEGVKTFLEVVPVPGALTDRLQHMGLKERRISGILGGIGLDRYTNRLQQCIHALSLQNSFVRHLLSTEAPPMVFWTKESGKVVIANARFLKLWEMLREGSSTPPDLEAFHHLLANNMIEEPGAQQGNVDPEIHQRKMLNRLPFSDGESVQDIVLRGSGHRIYLRVVYHEVDDAALGLEGIIASFTDVTEIRELERLKGEVMNIVSHELKLPLTTIMGYGEMLAESVEGVEKGYAIEVSRQAKRLARMIEDFLDIARIENGKYTVNNFPFNLLDVVNDGIAVAQGSAMAKDITITTRFPGKVSPLLGDEALMTQVVINLLDNAIKFSPNGTTVHVELFEFEDIFELIVADEGKGVADVEKERIFEKFTRGEAETHGSGFGLGLNFVRKVVHSHNGLIWVGDGEKGGAVFHVKLPRRTDRSEERETAGRSL